MRRLRAGSVRPPRFAILPLVAIGLVPAIRAQESSAGDSLVIDSGPFPLRLIHPLTMPFYQPVPDRARVLPRRAWGVSLISQYGNVQKGEGKLNTVAVFDSEFHRLALNVRYGLLERLELSVELPIYMRGAGFMDDLIRDFHRVTGVVRDDRSTNEHEERLEIRNQEIINVKSIGYRLGDIPVQLKYQVLDERSAPLSVAVRAALELPTGNEGEWIGSGGLDGGVGLLAERRWGSLSAYVNLDYRFFQNPGRFRSDGLDTRAVPSVAAAIQYQAWKPVALVLQVAATDDLFEGKTGFDAVDNPQVALHAGVRFRLHEHVRGWAGVSEDLVKASSPDVVFFFGLDFGPAY